ncbi:MAG TPA: serine hydrolase [Opitutaceae bacterium]|nr:serine hydrolase [Opitutaceae bacterium]
MSSIRILVALCLLASGAAAEGAAGDPSPRLPRSTPEEQGIPAAALLGFVQAAEQKIDALHSFMLVRHGHVVAEGWWAPYAADEPHALFSLSKSFTSTAVGLAVADGRLSPDDPVLKFFPDEAPAAPGKNLSSMRVRDLLRMATGQRDEDLRAFPFQSQRDLVRVFLELPVPDKPGTHFVYNTAATYMLSAIVQKVTGQTVLDYLKPRLFEPLGISDPAWEASAQGISFGGFGLSLRTEDIARFGQLYLQRGQWRGRQLVPAGWVDAATSLQTSNGSNPASDWDQGYGYQFWRCRHGFYRGDGAFGQYCVVMPEFDAVVAITGATRDLQSVLDVVWDRIVPAFEGAALPPDPESDRRLSDKLASLTLAAQSGQPESPMAARIAGRRYEFPANPQQIESIEFEPAREGAGVAIAVRLAGKDQRIECGRGAWLKGSLAIGPAGPVPIAACGAWSSDDTYTAVICRYRTPFSSTYDMRFSGDEAILETEDNVGLEPIARVRLVGRAQPK